MSSWIPVAKVQDLEEGKGVLCQAEGTPIALFVKEGLYHAIHHICPHKGGPLAEGELEGMVVRCPWHAWEFDIRDGCNPQNKHLKVPHFETKVEGQDVWVKI
ncbi:MAG: Rieske (2Fe-2S) protein [Deltaproteobacteria bacterium]|nr:Rieske (2Fe-2S) protein [Deltaproteobacteria bacterium]